MIACRGQFTAAIMVGEDGRETADQATMPWRDVLSLILSSSHEEDHEETARLCLTFLDKATAGAAGDDDVPPADVVATVRTTYVRSLLNAEEYEAVVEYCRSYRQASSGGGSGDGDRHLYLRQEEAYAQYRLKNYAKARDLCRSSLSAVGCDPDDLTATTSEVSPPLGLIHVYSQALYRLNETESAFKVYQFLQSEAAGVADDEEAGEIATNALANAAANVTYCGSSGGCADVAGDENAIMEQVNGVGDYNYDLARNYALLLLLQATSSSELHRVIKLLRQAEEGAQIALEEEEEELTDEEIQKELASIRADMATAQQLLGDRQSASRTYFELMKSDDPALQFVARHNLAVLSSGANPAAAAKQMPDLSDENVSSKLTPAQLRTTLFNRALLALANKKHDDARKAIAALKTAVAGGGAKKARRKGAGASAAAARQVLSAPPAKKDVHVALWSSRAALVESELLRAERKTEEAATALQTAIDALVAVEGPLEKGSNDIEAVQFGIAALALHKLEVERQSAMQPQAESSEEEGENEEDVVSSALNPIDVLSNLPQAIMTRPAILGALSSLYDQAGQEDKCTEIIDMLSTSVVAAGGSSDVETAKIKSSQYIKSGRYEDAVKVIRSVLDSDADLSKEVHMELTARLVQALSYVDPAEAQELVATLEEGEASVPIDRDEVESRETPRLGKGSGAPVSAKVGGDIGGESTEKNAKRDAILHRRSRKREAYLEKLEHEGRYNPDKPSKPDPERWIPKAQRSYNRRGRRGRQRFVGAQGGGTGAGADRDAAKLDAAARAAAKREGIAFGPSKASTAHMEVAGGGSSARKKGGRR